MITHHPDGSLSTTVHRKVTQADKYLDFQCHHLLAQKIAVPRTLYSRARSLCTYVEDLDQEVSHVMKALKWNGYPKSAIKMSYPQRQQANTNNKCPRATPTFVVCRSLSEESWLPFILECVFVRTEPYPTSLFTQKILCHLTRERELCIEFLVLTVT